MKYILFGAVPVSIALWLAISLLPANLLIVLGLVTVVCMGMALNSYEESTDSD